jgi:hypothetical protein
MLTGEGRYARGVHDATDSSGIHSPIRIGTLAECLRYEHAVAAYCPRCRRWTDLNLVRLVMRGYGDRPLACCRARCRVCDGPGVLQLRAPQPTWGGPASLSYALTNRT